MFARNCGSRERRDDTPEASGLTVRCPAAVHPAKSCEKGPALSSAVSAQEGIQLWSLRTKPAVQGLAGRGHI